MPKVDSETNTEQLGTPAGRFYRPPSVAPDEDKASSPAGTPEGRFYLPSSDERVPEPAADAAAETVQPEPVAAAGSLAGEPPTKDEVKAAKAEQQAAEKTGGPTADPAAEGLQPEPVEAAAELAQPGPVAEPKGNAGRDEWVLFARSKGATDADLVDAEGKDLGRDALREKYGTPPAS